MVTFDPASAFSSPFVLCQRHLLFCRHAGTLLTSWKNLKTTKLRIVMPRQARPCTFAALQWRVGTSQIHAAAVINRGMQSSRGGLPQVIRKSSGAWSKLRIPTADVARQVGISTCLKILTRRWSSQSTASLTCSYDLVFNLPATALSVEHC
jgi:hypothetical protein